MSGDAGPSSSGQAGSDTSQQPALVSFVIKNPSRASQESFEIKLSLEFTVGKVKERLQQSYPGNPAPARQTVIYAGKVLRDDATVLRDMIKQEYNPDVPYTLHLVVKDSPSGANVGPGPSLRSAAPSTSSQPAPTPATMADQPSSSTDPAGAGHDATAGSSSGGEHQPYPQQPYTYPYGSMAYEPPHVTSWDTTGAAAATAAAMNHPPQGYTLAAYPYSLAQNAAMVQQMYAAAYAAFECAAAAQQQQQQQQQGATSTSDSQPSTSAAAGGGASTSDAAGAAAAPPAPLPLPPPVLPPYLAPMAYMPWGMVPQMQLMPPQPGQQPQQQHPGMMPFAHMPFGGPMPFPPGAFPYPPGAYPYPPGAYPMYPPPPPGAQHVAGAGAAGGAPGMVNLLGNRPPGGARRPMVRVRMLRINVRMLLQLLVVSLIIYQHCPPGRFIMLVVGGLLLYLTTLTPLRRLLHRLVGLPHHHHHHNAPAAAGAAQQGGGAPAGGNGNGNGGGGLHQQQAAGGGAADGGGVAAGGAGGGVGGAGHQQEHHARAPPPPPGLLREVQALVMGFFTSLLPGWNYNPEDAAAFAAAQDMVAREDQQQQQQRDLGGGGAGQGEGQGGNGAGQAPPQGGRQHQE